MYICTQDCLSFANCFQSTGGMQFMLSGSVCSSISFLSKIIPLAPIMANINIDYNSRMAACSNILNFRNLMTGSRASTMYFSDQSKHISSVSRTSSRSSMSPAMTSLLTCDTLTHSWCGRGRLFPESRVSDILAIEARLAWNISLGSP